MGEKFYAKWLKRPTIAVWLPILVLLIGTSTFVWHHYQTSQNSSGETLQSLNFQIYYPSKLPNGYKLDQNSINRNQNVGSYTVSGPAGEKLFFSFQALPKPSVIDSFKSDKAAFAEDISCPLGKAFIAGAHGQTVGSITAENTWVLITAPPKANLSVLKQIIAAMKGSTSPAG